MSKVKPTVIDLFCGCGGLSFGFIEAGYDVVLGIDHWQDAIKTFEHNHKGSIGLVADLFNETPKELCKKTGIKKADIIIGGPPCQGFSIAGKRIVDDERNKLYKSFVSFVEFYKPHVFLMENVPNIVSMGKGIVKDNIIEDFERLGYNLNLAFPKTEEEPFLLEQKERKFSNSLKLKTLNLFHQVKPFLIYLKNQYQTEQNIH